MPRRINSRQATYPVHPVAQPTDRTTDNHHIRLSPHSSITAASTPVHQIKNSGQEDDLLVRRVIPASGTRERPAAPTFVDDPA
ncbi:hypothetical protein V22_34520 [Calycomorphotria hydatis]|uniref:Uncharacterized protein n=1 Tax=Calycomorphotria hydatis TaxID=2528027 RepID=A0A517TCU2_9PLAN|nr:hypothetical protein V22_34520 [Calycomorphotria hydatis]